MIRLAAIGLGNRTRKYLEYVQAHPEEVSLVAVVEPDDIRRQSVAAGFGLPEAVCFRDAKGLFAADLQIDGVIIASPDNLHFDQTMAAISHGWHVLLEKPVAESIERCRQISEAARRAKVQVLICYVLRYHPYYRKLRELVRGCAIGEVVSVSHRVNIGTDRMTHTYVRGPWGIAADSSPSFLSKCCHDADFLMWLSGGSVVEVHSSGVIRKFRPDHAPYGATARCTDCPVADCPYSAVRLYRDRREWVDGFDVPPGESLADVIDNELLTGRYGRCVYRCDNNVYDTQDVEATLSTGTKLHMHLEGTSMQEGRSTRIIGTKGVLEADGGHIVVPGLIDEDYSHLAGLPLHAGADRALVEDFFSAVSSGRAPLATLSSALEGHKLCFATV
jgi:predicted dehydrogenase